MSLAKIQYELKVQKSNFNKFGNYKYRNAEDILSSLKPLLKKYDSYLVINDTIELIGNRYYVKATATINFKLTETPVSKDKPMGSGFLSTSLNR